MERKNAIESRKSSRTKAATYSVLDREPSVLGRLWHWLWPLTPVVVLWLSARLWEYFAQGIYAIFLDPMYEAFYPWAFIFAAVIYGVRAILWRPQNGRKIARSANPQTEKPDQKSD